MTAIGLNPLADDRDESLQVYDNAAEMTEEEEKELAEIRRRKAELKQDIQALKDEIRAVTAEMEAMENVDEKTDPKAKQANTGRKKFNINAKKGMRYLIEQGLVNDTPEDVAAWLYKTENIDKTKIGEYLGENEEPNLTVLKEFVKLHEIRGLSLVDALRQFLWSFRLPGEAQKIDRMMEAFAQHYSEQNPGVFNSTDTCYVLSFSVIMLNTSLHNPSVKNKPNVDQFVTMNRGLDNGQDLPTDLLMSLYDNIKKEPFKVPEADENDLTQTFFNPEKKGWLTKQGGHHKNWKKRYFVLKDNCLYYFKSPQHKEPKGIVPLELLQVRDALEIKKPFCFEIYSNEGLIKACKLDSEGKVVEGHHSSYRIHADTEEDKDEWVKCIKASIRRDQFYEMLIARKKKVQKTH